MEIDAEQRWAIWGREGGYCGICFEPVPYREMHLDHIVPASLGGATEPANLRPTHARCNIGRGNGRVPRSVPRPLRRDGRAYVAKLVNFPPGLEDWIKSEALREHRSFNAQVLAIAGQWLGERDGADLPPAS